jgi:Holliday junction resolvasome RuvABC endonuclease subunit
MSLINNGPLTGATVPGLFLGLDPGTRCGWAILDRHEQRIRSGTWNCTPKAGEGPGMRYMRLRRHLRTVFAEAALPILAVGFEDVRRHLGVDAAHIYGGLVAVISEECERQSVAYRGIKVNAVKVMATGKGNADKDAVVRAANARWCPHIVGDDNEADALFVALGVVREAA